ncbi:MAG: hypothetical protein ACXVCM_15485, partial [Ktedonobacteraceae bacterium]
MQELFPGYYRPTKEEFSTMWQQCIFVFDANVLLNIYRYTATSNVLESASKYALCCSWLIPRCLITRLVLLWSYSRSPGRFPSGRSHCPRRHVQVEAEHAKCLYNDIHGGVLI